MTQQTVNKTPLVLACCLVAVAAVAGLLWVVLPARLSPVTSPTTDSNRSSTSNRIIRPTTTRPLSSTIPTAPPGVTEALSAVDTYILDAWCDPLQQASGHSLFTLERRVGDDLGQLYPSQPPALSSSLAPEIGQTPLVPQTSPMDQLDLASAYAVVPSATNPLKTFITTYYCVGAPAPAAVSSTGGFDTVQFEIGYALHTGTQTTYMHVWWVTTVPLVPWAGGFGLGGWAESGFGHLREDVVYWSQAQESREPTYTISEPHGGWELISPP